MMPKRKPKRPARKPPADDRKQILELWRTIRENVDLFRAGNAAMPAEERKQIVEMWRTIRKGIQQRK